MYAFLTQSFLAVSNLKTAFVGVSLFLDLCLKFQ